VSRALDILAWGLLVVPVLGLAFRILTAASHAIADGMAVEGCGSTDAAAVMMLLRDTWPVSALGEALVLATIDLRRDELRALSWQRRLVTLCTLLACPPLAVVTAFVAAQEYGTGGPGAVIFYPATIAAGATLCAWTAGGRWPAVHALRVIAGIVVVLGVTVVWPTLEALDLALGLPLDLGSLSSGGYRCASFWDSPAWSLVSMRHQGWVLVVVGVLLLFARNPEA
jgi:hypothetical protein